jgi:hypothetical protein
MGSDCHSFPLDGCDALWRSSPGLYTWLVRKPWWSNPRHKLTPVARCFTGLSLPHPPKPSSQIERHPLKNGLSRSCGFFGTLIKHLRSSSLQQKHRHKMELELQKNKLDSFQCMMTQSMSVRGDEMSGPVRSKSESAGPGLFVTDLSLPHPPCRARSA